MTTRRVYQRLLTRCLAMALLAVVSDVAVAGKSDTGSSGLSNGSRDRALIQGVIEKNLEQVRACYEEALLKQDPKLEGTITIEFSITSSGAVSFSHVAKSTVSNAALETCVAKRVATWVFPKGNGVQIVTYPFAFKQSSPENRPGSRMPQHDERGSFMDKALLRKLGWMSATKMSVSWSPECLLKHCDIRREISQLCAAFGDAGKRIDSGASYGSVIKPIMEAASNVCCDDSLNMLRAVGDVYDQDKYTIWCAVANDSVETDAGVAAPCGWAKCNAFQEFWSKFRKQPDTWFGSK